MFHRFQPSGTVKRAGLTDTQRRRRAVLQLFAPSGDVPAETFAGLSERQWKSLLRWLDTSGLALYFLARLEELGRQSVLPSAVAQRLRRNLADNTDRLAGMTQEAAEIRSAFQRAGLCYATLKGFSLWPDSVPRLELRSQLDLDFLIEPHDAPEARRILECRGYTLHAISGDTWEFKTVASRELTLADLYKPATQRTVELHLEPGRPAESRLERREQHLSAGVVMPVLGAVDLLLDQGRHLYKHLSRDAVRTAHVLEFSRHLTARHMDRHFFRQVETRIADDIAAQLSLGVAVLLVSREVGLPDQPPALRHCVDRLPSGVRLWVKEYGARVLYADFPGSKLHLLLQSEVESALGLPRRPLRRALLPLQLPRAIGPTPREETHRARLRRYRKQLWFVSFRLRFHVVEGLRYLWERSRWRRLTRQQGNSRRAVEQNSGSGRAGLATKG